MLAFLRDGREGGVDIPRHKLRVFALFVWFNFRCCMGFWDKVLAWD